MDQTPIQLHLSRIKKWDHILIRIQRAFVMASNREDPRLGWYFHILNNEVEIVIGSCTAGVAFPLDRLLMIIIIPF